MASDPTEIEILHLTQIVGTFESGSVKLACNIACFRCTALAQSTFLLQGWALRQSVVFHNSPRLRRAQVILHFYG